MTHANTAAPLVTVGIPFYNSEKTLLNAIKSVFSQTFQNWELILVDDGSSDRSLEIALSIDDPRVKVISDGQNKKLPARLNQIIGLARGKYIVRMDADDLCSPKRIERQLELFDKDESLDVVGTGMIYLDDNDAPLGVRLAPTSHSEICKEPYRMFGLCHSSVIVKKSWYEKNRYDESALQAEDFDLWLRSYEHSKFGNVPDALFFYKCEPSFSQRKRLRCRFTCARFLFKHYYERKQLCRAFYAASMQFVKLIVGFVICLVLSRRNLIERRYARINNEERQFYEQEIRKIKETKLPIKDYRLQ